MTPLCCSRQRYVDDRAGCVAGCTRSAPRRDGLRKLGVFSHLLQPGGPDSPSPEIVSAGGAPAAEEALIR